MTGRRALAAARERMRSLRTTYPTFTPDAVIAHWMDVASGDERTATLRYGADRLFGEVERRPHGVARLRAGERATTAEGVQLSIPFREMTFSQADAAVARRRDHAFGELEEARFLADVIAIAKQRCLERGLQPHETELAIGDFIDEDEIASMRRSAAA